MANTFTQIHIHFVFAVKYRQGQISPNWKERLYQYMSAIVNHNGHKMLIINGMPDHVHLLVGVRPHQSLADLMREVKTNTSKWINEQKFTSTRFAWQEGYGAFSYSKSELPAIISYIENQEEHHAKKTFQEEFIKLLEERKMEYDPKYLFQDPG